MIKKIFNSLLIALSLGAFSSAVVANPIKSVATVDMQKLFSEYHLTKGAQAKVKADQATIGKENNDKLAEIRKIASSIEAASYRQTKVMLLRATVVSGSTAVIKQSTRVLLVR